MKTFFKLLLVFLLVIPALAQEESQEFVIRFAATVGEDAAVCGQSYTGVGTDDAEITFTDFRMYISNVQLITAEGESVPLELAQDEMWQYETVTLLDFEDGSETCSETGNAATNGEIHGTAPAGDYVGVSFDLGIPFEMNHDDVTLAPSPLNVTSMFWSWQYGYKFVRIDLMTDASGDDVEPAWFIHLGSTGCEAAAAAVSPEEPCTYTNIPTIAFEEFDFENGVIVADLAGLLENVSLYENTPMPPGCMSGTDDPDCPGLFTGFGLDMESGICPDGDCSAQTFFRVSDVESVTLTERSNMMDMSDDKDMSGHEHHHGG